MLIGVSAYLMFFGFLSPQVGYAILLVASFTLTLTGSRSALWATLSSISISVLIVQWRAPNAKAFALLVMKIALIGTFSRLGQLAFQKYLGHIYGDSPIRRFIEFRNQNLQARLLSANGRVVLWRYVISATRNRRLLGGGYGAFWDTDRLVEARQYTGWRFAECHSIFLETFVSTGATGLALLLLILVDMFVLSLHANGTDFLLVVGVLTTVLVHGAVESTFAQPCFPSFVVAALCAAALPVAFPT